MSPVVLPQATTHTCGQLAFDTVQKTRKRDQFGDFTLETFSTVFEEIHISWEQILL